MMIYRAFAIAMFLACSTESGAQTRFTRSENGLLQAHNYERQLVGAPPLVWSAGLAAAADKYALHLAQTNRWSHSQPNQRVGQGENLWMGSRGAYPIYAMVSAWTSEKRLFRAGVFPDVSRAGLWSGVGHYTQMVWPATASVGCSVRSSAQWDYLVCRYSSAGNVVGQRVGAARMAAK